MRGNEIIAYICILLIGIFFIFPVLSNTNTYNSDDSRKTKVISFGEKPKKKNLNFSEVAADKLSVVILSIVKNFTDVFSEKLAAFFLMLLVFSLSIPNFVNKTSLKEKVILRLRI